MEAQTKIQNRVIVHRGAPPRARGKGGRSGRARGLLRDFPLFPLFHDFHGRPPFPLQHAVAAMGGAETCHSTCMLGHDCTVVLLKSYCGTLCVILIAYFAAC